MNAIELFDTLLPGKVVTVVFKRDRLYSFTFRYSFLTYVGNYDTTVHVYMDKASREGNCAKNFLQHLGTTQYPSDKIHTYQYESED